MAKLLQRSFLYGYLALSLFVLTSGVQSAYGQILINGENTHQISFTAGETSIDNRSARISLSDVNKISVFDYQPTLSVFSNQSADNFYVTDKSGDISVGKLSSDSLPADLFFPVSFENSTDHPIGSFQLSFDFIYNFVDNENDFSLILKYRVNDDDFRNTELGIIKSEVLSSNSDEWSSFSIQLSINDIYLRPEDRVDFMWVIEDHDQDLSTEMPLALTRMETRAGIHREKIPEPGSLIISEILPPFEYNEVLKEYIEIYNPADYPVSIKGIEVQTPNSSFVIQQDLYVEPFGLFVLNRINDGIENPVQGDLNYSQPLLSSRGGRVELSRDGQTISRATYEAADPGVALELNHTLNAYDGYASLSHFAASEIRFNDFMNGSPGELGNTVPIFRHTLPSDGWYFYSPPGRLIDQLNRSQSLYYFDDGMNSISSVDIEPFSPVLMFNRSSDNSYVYVEEVNNRDLSLSSFPVGEHSKMVQTPTHKVTSLNRLTDEIGNRLSPAVLIWNHERNRFEIKTDGEDIIEGWQPIIVNRSVSDQVQVSENNINSNGRDISRYIDLSLFEEGNNRVTDRAVIGFMNQSGSKSDHKYSLPKLLTDFDRNNDKIIPDYSFLYLASQISEESSNSFLQLPAEIDRAYELRLGHYLKKEGGRATLRWNISQDIPEEWILTLQDNHTGDVTDMREESAYSFLSARNGEREFRKNSDSPISVVESDGEERFLITLQPYESLIEEETDNKPETVELRHNYPNPFNPATNIVYFLPEAQQVRVGVYNVVGQQVAILVDETMRAGEHSVIWNASDMPSGIYIVQLETGNRIFTRKITLIK